jgi:hypothetical protein
MSLSLAPHPRLYIGPEHLRQLSQPPSDDSLRGADEFVRTEAQRLLKDRSITIPEGQHNWHLIRARRMQQHTFCLLTEYKRTGDKRYRAEVLKCVKEMSEWEYWSWIAWRKGDARPEAIFDLSCGENSATLAVIFDLLHDELTDAEKDLFVQMALRRSLRPYIEHNGGEKQDWYYKKFDTNWNTVCNGGAGMLALALHEFCPEAARVIEIVERGVAPYFEALRADGAWPEGIGYWNYGMRYGFMYLLSHERATGKKHPLLERPATEATLLFPLQFTPNGVPCSFSDINHFHPMPFHLAAAERYGRWDIVAQVLDRVGLPPDRDESWPNRVELLLLHPRERQKKSATPEWKKIALMDGLEWGYVADRMPNPTIYASVRGGTTKVPHGHLDLLSFHCVVGDEALINNIGVDEYHDSTFGPRRYELYEMTAPSKNSVFINGVGIALDSTVTTSIVSGGAFNGFRLDATEALGRSHDGAAAKFCGRAILLFEGMGLLVVDRFELQFPGLIESRLHTYSSVELEKKQAWIRGQRQALHVSFAASLPSSVKRAEGLPTNGADKADTMLRHYTDAKTTAATLCSFLSPTVKGDVRMVEEKGKTIVTLVAGNCVTVEIGERLQF